jgi:two-component system, chemotaxis family, response regulator Rcp1
VKQEQPEPILIVDDNPAHRTLIKRAIRKAGFQNPLLEAGNLEQARSLLLGNAAVVSPPALAIVDLNLGTERGTSLVSELRSVPQYKDLPIMILSTSALEDDIRESYAEGANCYLVKTEDLSTFTHEIGAGVSFLLTLGYSVPAQS